MKLPKYRLHKPSGRAVVQHAKMFGKNPHYLPGPYNSAASKAAYRRICEAILAAKYAERPITRPVKGTGTVNDLLKLYMPFAKSYYGEDSRSEFTNMVAAVRPLREKHGRTPLVDFGPIALKQVRDRMVGLGWSRRHINAQVHRVRRVFRWGVAEELVDASTLHALDAVDGLREGRTTARERPPVVSVAWDTVEQVLPFVAPLVATMIHLQFLTGMRSDELTQLMPVDIDRSGPIWIFRPGQHKTKWRGKEKLIPIGPIGQELLAPYLDIKPNSFVFQPAIAVKQITERRAANRKTPKAKNPPARRIRKVKPRYTAASYQHAILHGLERLANSLGHIRPPLPMDADAKPTARTKRVSLRPWLKSLNIAYWHPHQLRHTRATLARESYGIEGAQALTGNAIEAAEIYAEKSLDLAKRIASETG